MVYLAADGEQGIPGGVHENDLTFTAGDVVVNTKDKVTLGIKHCEAVAIE